jgi:hypothetical protein
LQATKVGLDIWHSPKPAVRGSGSIPALPDYAPGVSLQSLTSPHPPQVSVDSGPGNTSTAPLINSRPPVRAKVGCILLGAMCVSLA